MWDGIKQNPGLADKIQEEVKNAPDVLQLLDWQQEEIVDKRLQAELREEERQRLEDKFQEHA
jgi:predicted esterase YcpF (UPF0227 family)